MRLYYDGTCRVIVEYKDGNQIIHGHDFSGGGCKSGCTVEISYVKSLQLRVNERLIFDISTPHSRGRVGLFYNRFMHYSSGSGTRFFQKQLWFHNFELRGVRSNPSYWQQYYQATRETSWTSSQYTETCALDDSIGTYRFL